jgi:rhodanese-related sulfurtransferase
VRGIKLPANVAVRQAAPNVPANCAAFLGAWGNGRWNGERSAEVWVESVEPDCSAKAIYARGGQGLSGEQATYLRGDARISGDRLTLDWRATCASSSRAAAIAPTDAGPRLSIRRLRNSRASPAVPDRPVTLFAKRGCRFRRAAESAVISASQINTNERSAVETMLPLPAAVPGVDTLTTTAARCVPEEESGCGAGRCGRRRVAQDVAERVLDAGAGSVQLGQKEREQIEATLREANAGDLSRPIVVFERSSTYGWFGYHSVLRLLGMGYTNIYWYRGGLDAWHDAQFALAQATPWGRAR